MSFRRLQELQQGRRNRIGALARHEVAGAVDDATGHELRERRPLIGILSGRSADAVARAIQGDCRCDDAWTLREALLDLQEPGFTWCVSDAVAIGMNHHVDEVGIVERGCRLLVGVVRELPRRRPGLPQESADRLSITFETDAAALGVEVVLVPKRALGGRRRGRW